MGSINEETSNNKALILSPKKWPLVVDRKIGLINRGYKYLSTTSFECCSERC